MATLTTLAIIPRSTSVNKINSRNGLVSNHRGSPPSVSGLDKLSIPVMVPVRTKTIKARHHHFTSLGSNCRTPCSIELSVDGPFTVTFTHRGFAPSIIPVEIEPAQRGASVKFAPDPVQMQLGRLIYSAGSR